MNRRIGPDCSESPVRFRRQRINSHLKQILQGSTDDVEGEVEHQQHNENKARDGRVFTSENPVNFLRSNPSSALLRLYDRRLADTLDEVVLHIGNGGRAVHTALLFHLHNDVLDHVFLILLQVKLLQDQRITLDDLVRGEAKRESRPLGVVLDDRLDRMMGAVNGPAVVILRTEILDNRLFLIFCDMDGMTHEFIDAFILCRRNRNDRDAEHLLHSVDVDGPVVFHDLVHHVQGHDHRHIHFEKLHCKIQIALDVRRIDDIDDCLRFVDQDKIPGDDLLTAVRRHGINAGKIRDHRLRMSLDRTVLAVNRDTRKISHMLIGAGQLIEQRRLAAVLVSHECKGENRSLRKRCPVSLAMIFSVLAESRVICVLDGLDSLVLIASFFDEIDPDLLRIGKPQRQLISMNLQLHRVAHRRKFHHRELCSRDDAHVEEMLPESAFAPDRPDDCILTNLQIS